MQPAIFAIVGSSAMLVNAQATQSVATTTESLTPFQSTQATCIAQCHVADNGCRTKCIQVHNPSADPIQAIQKCQAGCVQGDGSSKQTSIYGMCLQDCINSGGADPTMNNAVASTSSDSAATRTASSAVVAATTSGAVAGSAGNATSNAADTVHNGMCSCIFGLLAVFFM